MFLVHTLLLLLLLSSTRMNWSPNQSILINVNRWNAIDSYFTKSRGTVRSWKEHKGYLYYIIVFLFVLFPLSISLLLLRSCVLLYECSTNIEDYSTCSSRDIYILWRWNDTLLNEMFPLSPMPVSYVLITFFLSFFLSSIKRNESNLVSSKLVRWVILNYYLDREVCVWCLKMERFWSSSGFFLLQIST